MIRHVATAFADYLDIVSGYLDGSWYFRGHADQAWPLVPSAGRPDVLGGRTYDPAREIALFAQFRWEASRFDLKPMEDIEMLALARHHRLPTRLLDWSANPLTAAFFTMSGAPKADGLVHCIRVKESALLRNVADPFSPGVASTPVLIEVPPRHARVTAQQGIFSLHPDPTAVWKPSVTAGVIDYATCRIPALSKPKFERALWHLDFNDQRLMADLDGLSAKLACKYRWT